MTMAPDIRQKHRDPVILFIFFVMLGVQIYSFSSGISGNDFWWHVKVGEYVVKTRSVPTTDIFSWIGMEKGIAWTAHEWLSDVLFYYIYSAAGGVGIYLLSVSLAVFLSVLLWRQAREALEENILVCGLFFSLFAVLTSLFFYGRPHVFSFFLLFFELKILYSFYENASDRRIWWIPVLAALWSNLHGGSANLSYLLCFAFLIVALCSVSVGRVSCKRLPKSALLRLFAVSLLSLGAILINPIGGRVLIYPYASFADSISMQVISEWHPPDAKAIGNLVLYFLPIGVIAFGMVSTERKIRAIDVVVMALFLLLFFRSARFIILWYIAAVFCGFLYIPKCKVKAITRPYEKVLLGLAGCLIPICLFGFGIYQSVTAYQQGDIVSTAARKEAIEYVKHASPKRLFNDYNVGESLIFNDLPVFFDARADLFAQEHIMEDGISLLLLEQARKDSSIRYVNVQEIIQRYRFDAVFILKTRPLYAYLISHPEQFRLDYEDESMGYFTITADLYDKGG